MNHYIDWEFYNSLFTDVTEAEFNRIIPRVTNKINAVTHMRVREFENTLPTADRTDYQNYTHTAIQLTCCDLVNLISKQDNSAIGTGIASVSNDGYSESYVVKTQAEKEAEIIHSIRSGLAGTGMASAI